MIKEKRDIRNKNIEIDYVENKLDVEDISKKYGIGSYYVNKILTETLKITLRPFRKNKYRERNLLIKK